MDIAYDHIQEESLTPEQAADKARSAETAARQHNLPAEFQETYKTFAATSWGKSLGGFFSDVKKQGESFYDEAKQEAGNVGGEAFKGFTGLRETLVGRARSMSGTGTGGTGVGEGSETPKASDGDGKARSESETLRDSESVISRFRSEAAKRLRDLEKAEEAADAAIFKFGANIGNFLKEAVSVAPPTSEEDKKSGKVLFESRDVDGKRVIHSTRFEAQLHAVHSSFESFKKDPASPEYEKWKADFDVEKKTEAIAKDLEKYEELRRAMEKLVPEQVEYPVFWTRYYFLRMVVETEEERRREILKATAQSHTDTPIAWDDDSDSDNEAQSSTPQQQPTTSTSTTGGKPDDPTATPASSTTTLHPHDATTPTAKPGEPRRSQDGQSQADSDASYDLVSGATSRAPGSPKEGRVKKEEDEEEEDWE